jgi:hypothetical protein
MKKNCFCSVVTPVTTVLCRLSRVPRPHLPILILAALLLASHVTPPRCAATDLDSTFATSFVYREAFLPPGMPSVALRTDETAILWNPAGMAMSDAYHLGYAWKGTYCGDDKVVSTHFFLTKARGFGFGFMKDDYSEGTQTATLFSLAPRVHRNLGLGFTGKWKGGFNFDAGAILALGKNVIIAGVAKNIRDREDARKYYEGGIAVFALPERLTLFFDFIDEDSRWRNESAYGGGIVARLQRSVAMSASYFVDESDNQIWRGSLRVLLPREIVEGEYSAFSNDWQTVSARIASRSSTPSSRRRR